MRATPLPLLYQAAASAPFPSLSSLSEGQRVCIQYLEKFKQKFEDRHPLHQLEELQGSSWLKTRRSFMNSVSIESSKLKSISNTSVTLISPGVCYTLCLPALLQSKPTGRSVV